MFNLSCNDNFIIVSSYIGSKLEQRFGNTAFIYQKVEGIWDHKPVLNITGYTDKAWFGSRVQISDSYAAVIAAQGFDSNGAQTTFIFKRNATSGKWDDPNHVQSIYQGGAWQLSLSQHYLLIGGSNEVAVYELGNNPTKPWSLVKTLTGSSSISISPLFSFILLVDHGVYLFGTDIHFH